MMVIRYNATRIHVEGIESNGCKGVTKPRLSWGASFEKAADALADALEGALATDGTGRKLCQTCGRALRAEVGYENRLADSMAPVTEAHDLGHVAPVDERVTLVVHDSEGVVAKGDADGTAQYVARYGSKAGTIQRPQGTEPEIEYGPTPGGGELTHIVRVQGRVYAVNPKIRRPQGTELYVGGELTVLPTPAAYLDFWEVVDGRTVGGCQNATERALYGTVKGEIWNRVARCPGCGEVKDKGVHGNGRCI